MGTGCRTSFALRRRLSDRLSWYGEGQTRVVVPASTGQRLEWERGQSVVFAQTERGDTTLVQISVDQRIGDTAALTFVELSEYETSVVTVQLSCRPSSAEEALGCVDTLQIARGDNELTHYRFNDVARDDRRRLLLETVQRRWLPLLVTPTGAQSTQTVTTRAGTFEGCEPFVGTLPIRNEGDATLRGWLHSAVPLAPVVQAVSDNGKRSIELLDFGLSAVRRI